MAMIARMMPKPLLMPLVMAAMVAKTVVTMTEDQGHIMRLIIRS